MNTRRFVAAACVAFAVSILPTVVRGSSPPSGVRASTLAIAQAAPALNLEAVLDGPAAETLTWTGALRGQVVVIDFWATWCAPCIESFPDLNELVKPFADQPVVFLSVTRELTLEGVAMSSGKTTRQR